PRPGGTPSRSSRPVMCTIYASAVRRMLPSARLVVDLFHVVQLAVKMTGDVRRRAVREKYGRRPVR
ncbi:MAG: transposase, partial [Streptosporangiaceae bacterium]